MTCQMKLRSAKSSSMQMILTTMSYAADTIGELEGVLEKEVDSIDRWVDRNRLKLNVKKLSAVVREKE